MFTNQRTDRRTIFPRGLLVLTRSFVGWRRRLAVGSLVATSMIALCGAVPAPDKLTAGDRQAIEAVIRQQLDAFVRDDAERAFTFATPEIQRQFGNSDRFVQVVRDRYAPVYRASGVRFVRLALTGGDWVQTVQLSDDEGRVWRALFTMRRQPDRGWKVGGCQLVETSALAT